MSPAKKRGWAAIEMLPAASGCYALVLKLDAATGLWVGRLGRLRLAPGYYVYVGSAFGSGGVRARLKRHWSGTGRRHWHIDYLRSVARPVAAWYQVQQISREHDWAAALARGRGLEPVANFGCTDCNCPSHLFYSVGPPSRSAFRRRLGGRAAGDGPHRAFQ